MSPSAGPHLDDFHPGDVLSHRGRRVVTEADRVWFAALTMNSHVLHVGTADPHGVVPVSWTLAVVIGLSVEDVSWNATANISWSDITFPAPVRVGDTIKAHSVVRAVDRAAATITVTTTGVNQEDDEVLVLTRTIALARGELVDGSSARRDLVDRGQR